MTSENKPLRFLAWPDWTEERDMGRLVALASPLANRPEVQLVLIRDPVNDPSEATAFESLQRAFDLRFPPQATLDVLVSDRGQPPSELARDCDALLTLGTEAPELISAVGLPQLDSPVRVLEMLVREGRGIAIPEQPVASNLAERPENAPVISVIVPAYGRPEKLLQLMDSLEQQDLNADKFELLVSDDGSDPPILESLDLSKPSYGVVVLQQDNSGPAAARNAAIRHARGALLVFLDDDSIPGEACLSGHLAAQLQASGNTAVMGGFMLVEAHRGTSISRLIEESPMIYPHPALQAGRIYNADCMRTANLSIPKALIEAVGGFDETFRVPCAEDAELAKRLKRALGTHVLYDPEITCQHDHAPTVDDLANRQQDLGWSTSYMAWRHDDHTLIVGGNAAPPGEQFWVDLETRLDASVDRVEQLLEELRQTSIDESEGGPPESLNPDYINKFKEVGFAFFSRGLIDGHREIQEMISKRIPAGE